MMDSIDFKTKLTELESQLNISHEKLLMRENVISQLEEEIKGKERLIFEQNHLINILENESASQTQLQAIRCDNNNKYDTDSINSESEITVIEREIVASSSSTSPCSSEKSGSSGGGIMTSSSLFRSSDDCHRDLFRCDKSSCKCESKLEQAMVDRERLELQNEQLLKQWEEALEYVSSVQRQLQEELKRNGQLKNEMNQRAREEVFEIPRNVLHLMSFIILVFGYLLYRL
ncbi:hypothetical protein GCK72_023156 [Caenorhabditis remanei]|uniref:Uncharacterized protein n=1 Tax=Caenorhabditis remanei TaxID=31234 RepID=A0A6A5FWB2_CAERE|nr:hypothetical protein GCK72_023156 [Caenorhabditis remanei]KAF1746699.1 hypothetical protein GCK72_023156 [Caenorhabditis remanei]